MGASNSQQQLSPHSQAKRNSLPEKNAYSKNIRIALYQHDRFALQKLTGYDPSERQNDPRYKITAQNASMEFLSNRFCDLHPEFVADNLSVECFVELIEKRWDTETVRLFLSLKGIPSKTLATLLATCVIRNHYPALNDVIIALHNAILMEGFAQQVAENPSKASSLRPPALFSPASDCVPRLPIDFVKAHHLHHLFPIVCHQNEEGILMTFVEAGLYDPLNSEASAAALRIVASAAMRAHARALQRIGNAILSPLPPLNTGEGGANADSAAAPSPSSSKPVAPEWFIDMLKEVANRPLPNAAAGGDAEGRTQGDGVTAAPIGTHGGGGASSSSVSSSANQPACPLSDDELCQSLMDTSVATPYLAISDAIAPFIAPLILILSTHQYPGHKAIQSMKEEALRTAVIKIRGSREVSGWQLYVKQQEVLRQHKERLESESPASSPSRVSLRALATNPTIAMPKGLPLLSPVAAILAIADGPWTADAHRMHSPVYRRRVRLLFHALLNANVTTSSGNGKHGGGGGASGTAAMLANLRQLSEDDINGILAYVGEEEEEAEDDEGMASGNGSEFTHSPSKAAASAAEAAADAAALAIRAAMQMNAENSATSVPSASTSSAPTLSAANEIVI